jgi:hypothetical protein
VIKLRILILSSMIKVYLYGKVLACIISYFSQNYLVKYNTSFPFPFLFSKNEVQFIVHIFFFMSFNSWKIHSTCKPLMHLNIMLFHVQNQKFALKHLKKLLAISFFFFTKSYQYVLYLYLISQTLNTFLYLSKQSIHPLLKTNT